MTWQDRSGSEGGSEPEACVGGAEELPTIQSEWDGSRAALAHGFTVTSMKRSYSNSQELYFYTVSVETRQMRAGLRRSQHDGRTPSVL